MILILLLLAGFIETPPADYDFTISLLKDSMLNASPSSLGLFFAEIGLEAAPGELPLWGDDSYYELIIEFSDYPSDSSSSDSLLPLLEGLPLDLLSE